MDKALSRSSLQTLANGILCIYKPPDVSNKYLRLSFLKNLCAGIDEISRKHPCHYLEIEETKSGISTIVRESYADKLAVAGPKITTEDISCNMIFPGRRTSGVCGIGSGVRHVITLSKENPLKVMQVWGKLGEATQYLYKNEKVVGKASYKHVDKKIVDNVVSSFQAAHQRQLYTQLGVDLKTQEAYELVVKGMIRPSSHYYPSIYNMKCILFNPPYFTLEIASINTNENYLLRLVYDLGLKLKTVAHCTRIRCIRLGPFTVNNSLSQKEWNLENLEENMQLCKAIFNANRAKNRQFLSPAAQKETV